MKYDIFKTKHQTLLSNKKIAKSLKKAFGRLPTYEELLDQDTELAVSIGDVLAVNTNAEELFFERSGRKLVFVDKSIVEMLNRAKFTANQFAKILPPQGFETFALCFEKDTYIEVAGRKVKLFPCQVTVMREKAMGELIHQPFFNLTGYEIKRNKELDIAITVSYKIGEVTYRSCVDVSEIIDKLNNNNIHQSSDAKLHLNQFLDDEEKLITNTLMRIAVQLLIFNSATNNQYLVKGFPSECKFRMPENTTRTTWRASHFNYKATHSVSSHIRSSHFRCLQNDRYYQNDFSHMPKGSRWILVKESFVGKQETFTQKNK